MKINDTKCKIISPSDQRIVIDEEKVEDVELFVFLGSVVPNSAKDVTRRIGLASTAFGRLRDAIGKQKSISNALKIRIYNVIIMPIATYAYASETLRSGKTRTFKVFEMRCLREILRVTRKKKAEKRAHPQRTSDEKHNH